MKILDLSAGNRAIWIQKELDFVTFLDKRPETNPTFLCDTTEIPEQVGKGFDLVVFDPPHLNAGVNSNVSKSYGHHTTQEIKETIAGSARESHRVSKEKALMAFKWRVMLLRRDEPGKEINMKEIGRQNKRARATHEAR